MRQTHTCIHVRSFGETLILFKFIYMCSKSIVYVFVRIVITFNKYNFHDLNHVKTCVSVLCRQTTLSARLKWIQICMCGGACIAIWIFINFNVTVFVWILFIKLYNIWLSSTQLWRNVDGKLLFKTWHVILFFCIVKL